MGVAVRARAAQHEVRLVVRRRDTQQRASLGAQRSWGGTSCTHTRAGCINVCSRAQSDAARRRRGHTARDARSAVRRALRRGRLRIGLPEGLRLDSIMLFMFVNC